MEFIRFFDNKKRELSSQSNDGDDAKRLCTEQLDNLLDDSMNDEIFVEGFQSPEFIKILIKCLKNLENKVQELCLTTGTTKEQQIKGDKHLTELKVSVDFISKKFDQYEVDRKEREEEIKNLKSEVRILKKENEDLEKQMDEQEQYSRRNCLLLHGVAEEQDEETDKVSVDVIKKNMDLDIDETDLDRTHRLGKPREVGAKPRPIIIKFSRYNVRHSVFKNKKKLKGKGVSITESLTKRRMAALTKAKEEHGFTNVWSVDGKIFYKVPGSNPKMYEI